MATIDDLESKALKELTDDELMSRLRDIRLSRRTPKKKKQKKEAKPRTITESIGNITSDQAANLLKILEERKK